MATMVVINASLRSVVPVDISVRSFAICPVFAGC